MNVAILTDGIIPFVLGGMQRHSSNLIRSLSKSGVNITIYHCVYNSDLPSEKEVNISLFGKDEINYVKVVAIQFPSSFWFPGHYIYRSRKYSNYIYRHLVKDLNKYNFIYAKGFTAWKLLKARKKGIKTPIIGVNFHGYEMWQYAPSFNARLKNYFLRTYVKWNSKNADYVFSYGSKITSIIKGIGIEESKIVEIPSGIEKDWLRNTSIDANNTIKFLFLGRYERRKGVEELNIVLKKIVDQNLNIEFHFIGPIPEIKRIKNLSNKVIYHGRIIDIGKIKSIMDNCDILICPSYSEGMPNVILEGMSRGLAVIATDVGANELLVSNENGKLIKFTSRENLIENLHNSIIELASLEKSHLLIKKEASIKNVTDFTFDKVAESHISFFKQFNKF